MNHAPCALRKRANDFNILFYHWRWCFAHSVYKNYNDQKCDMKLIRWLTCKNVTTTLNSNIKHLFLNFHIDCYSSQGIRCCTAIISLASQSLLQAHIIFRVWCWLISNLSPYIYLSFTLVNIPNAKVLEQTLIMRYATVHYLLDLILFVFVHIQRQNACRNTHTKMVAVSKSKENSHYK